jgi:hypothetical protein
MGINIEYVGNNSRPAASRDKYIGLVWGIDAVPAGAAEKTIISIFSKEEIATKVFVSAGSILPADKLLYYHLSTIFSLSPFSVVQLYLTTTITIDDLNVFDASTQLLGYFTGSQAVDSAAVVTLVNSAQTKLLEMLAVGNKSATVVVSTGLKNITYTNLPDFETTGTANLVMLDCAQDFSDNNLAKQVYTDNEKLCGAIGLILGSFTKNSVRHHIGDHTENVLTPFVTKAIIPTSDEKDTINMSKTEKEALYRKGIVFIEKSEQLQNIFFQNSRTCTKLTDAMNEMFIARPFVKVAKIVGDITDPIINSTNYFFNADSTMKATDIFVIKQAIQRAIELQMLAGSDKINYELDYENGSIPVDNVPVGVQTPEGIYIDPSQKVKLDGVLTISTCLRYKGAIRTITNQISVFLQ